jgi:RNA polymerase-binding transcription factor DksA
VNDRATQEEEFAIELRTRDRERKLIRKIEQSLKRFKTMITVSVKPVVSKSAYAV